MNNASEQDTFSRQKKSEYLQQEAFLRCSAKPLFLNSLKNTYDTSLLLLQLHALSLQLY